MAGVRHLASLKDAGRNSSDIKKMKEEKMDDDSIERCVKYILQGSFILFEKTSLL